MVINIIQVDPLFFKFRSYIDLLIFGDPTLFCTEPNKPKGWNEPLNRMSEEEWQEYFRLREELDVQMSDNEIKQILDKTSSLSEFSEEKINLLKKLPLLPSIAYGIKLMGGLKEIMHSNLSLAKKVYPDEF